MDERGLWELFFATGLPEAYLAIVYHREDRGRTRREELARTAFQPRVRQV